MLIKQENMMGSPEGYPGNMGVCPRGVGTSNLFSYFTLFYALKFVFPLSCSFPYYLSLGFSLCHCCFEKRAHLCVFCVPQGR